MERFSRRFAKKDDAICCRLCPLLPRVSTRFKLRKWLASSMLMVSKKSCTQVKNVFCKGQPGPSRSRLAIRLSRT